MSSGRKQDGTFQKGVSGNPGGRAKGLATLINELTKDGRTYTETMVKISEGEKVFGLEITTKDVREAIEWLADRAYGKPTQALEHAGPEGGALVVEVLSYVGKAP